jgi:hypothetical protein
MRKGVDTGVGGVVDVVAGVVIVRLGGVLVEEEDAGSPGDRLDVVVMTGGPLVVGTIGLPVLGFDVVDNVRIGDIDCPSLVVLNVLGTVLELVILPKTTVDVQ